MNLLPVFLNLQGRRCLLVGAGVIGLEKAGSLLNAGALLKVIAPEAHPEMRELADAGRLLWIQRAFELWDLEGCFLVITATNFPSVNAAVYEAALERGIPCNSVDDIPNCDFFFGSVVNRGQLQVAISTAGESPAVAQRLRKEIDAQLPQDLGPWLASLGQLRREVLAVHPRSEERKALLHTLAQRSVCESSFCPSRRLAYEPLETGSTPSQGKVWLVGAGPGDPDLLTVKAHRIIESAQVVLHDDLVPDAILALATRGQVVNVGKRCGHKSITQDQINAMMIEFALDGKRVVRLKSGDPLVFGRAAEEMGALKAAQIEFEIVPGITAAFAAAAAIECTLTDRATASSLSFTSGHHASSEASGSPDPLKNCTRVVYMPGRDLTSLAEQWRREGLPPNLPCAIVSHAGQPDQRVFFTTLALLNSVPAIPAPSIVIGGWVLRDARQAPFAADRDIAALSHSGD